MTVFLIWKWNDNSMNMNLIGFQTSVQLFWHFKVISFWFKYNLTFISNYYKAIFSLNCLHGYQTNYHYHCLFVPQSICFKGVQNFAVFRRLSYTQHEYSLPPLEDFCPILDLMWHKWRVNLNCWLQSNPMQMLCWMPFELNMIMPPKSYTANSSSSYLNCKCVTW